MRQTIILFIVGICLLSLTVYGLWLLFESILGMYKDWKLGKELDELERMGRERRSKKRDATP